MAKVYTFPSPKKHNRLFGEHSLASLEERWDPADVREAVAACTTIPVERYRKLVQGEEEMTQKEREELEKLFEPLLKGKGSF